MPHAFTPRLAPMTGSPFQMTGGLWLLLARRATKVPSVSLTQQNRIAQPNANGPDSPDSDFSATARDIYAALLRVSRFSQPAYEYWEPVVMGGLSGAYQLTCPFDTTAEYRILYLASTDTAIVYVGKLPNFAAPTNATNIGGDPTIGTPVPDPGLQGVVLTAAANTTTPGPDEWLPYAQGQVLSIRLTVATDHAAWVGVLWRRRQQASGIWLEGA